MLSTACMPLAPPLLAMVSFTMVTTAVTAPREDSGWRLEAVSPSSGATDSIPISTTIEPPPEGRASSIKLLSASVRLSMPAPGAAGKMAPNALTAGDAVLVISAGVAVSGWASGGEGPPAPKIHPPVREGSQISSLPGRTEHTHTVSTARLGA